MFLRQRKLVARAMPRAMRLAVVNANKGLYTIGRRQRLVNWIERVSADLLVVIEPWTSYRGALNALGRLMLLGCDGRIAAYGRRRTWYCARPVDDRWIRVDYGQLSI